MAALHCVTGAFGYSGKYIALRLLREGFRVSTLTNSPDRPNPFGEAVTLHPYDFDKPDRLRESLRGVDVLYNTYWVRFDHGDFSHSQAVRNTEALFAAAKDAGVRRIVHVSITNPSLDSKLPYFEGKARLEASLASSGISYAILRPTVLFGSEDILVNNIAWALRRFPVIGLFGDGRYKIQPIYVDDLAVLAVEQGAKDVNTVVDAIGPETFTYAELVEAIGSAIGKRRPLLALPPNIALAFCALAGRLVGDRIVTKEEVDGLMENLLVTNSPPAGSTALTDWARENADSLGRRYASELARRRNRAESYEAL